MVNELARMRPVDVLREEQDFCFDGRVFEAIECGQVEIDAILVRFAAAKDRAFDRHRPSIEPAENHTGDHVRRVEDVM